MRAPSLAHCCLPMMLWNYELKVPPEIVSVLTVPEPPSQAAKLAVLAEFRLACTVAALLA